MKLSLAWIFDHINADWKKQDVDHLVAQFNKTTAEVEDFYRVAFDMSNFYCAFRHATSATGITLELPELGKQIELPIRTNTVDMIPVHVISPCFMVKKEGDAWRWATLADFGVEKEGLVPALDVSSEDAKGAWRDQFESEDYILEVDNKSITHRPDMWGHRGFAREIAAFLNLPLRPEHEFLKALRISKLQATKANQAPQACNRYAGLFMTAVENKSTPLLVASRLLKVGSRPINAVVDLTNYCMLDWSQPMHAYDAEKISGGDVVIRMAKDQEPLALLDGNEIKLTTQDLVIADDKKPLCLAGVMGGAQSGLSGITAHIFIEAASFDAGYVRRTAQRHKTRTESSARFEKTLDPNQITTALQRFASLVEAYKIKAIIQPEIMVDGDEILPPIIEVAHEFFEQRIGMPLQDATIIRILSRLEFKVLKSENEDKKIVYLITPPSFRASKDVKIKEDILEEVVRCFGFENIELSLPCITRTPFDFSPITRLGKIKRFLAYSAHMTEQQSYAMYDEASLASLGLSMLESAASIVNPVSENFARMVESLVPGLLKNIAQNHTYYDSLSFFECGRVWHKHDKETQEQQSVSGIFFAKRTNVDFYQCKFHVMGMLQELGFCSNDIAWTKVTEPQQPWFQPYQTATIMYKKQVIGIAGKANPAQLAKLDIGVACDAFIFELDGNFLLSQQLPVRTCRSLCKFQETYFDVSLFVPRSLETTHLEQTIKATSSYVMAVELIDVFEKESASADQARALTMRVWVSHPEKTFEKAELDALWKDVTQSTEKLGAKVRM